MSAAGRERKSVRSAAFPEEEPTSHANPLAAARSHYRARRLSEAEELSRRHLETDPSDPDALELLGRIVLETGRGAFAVALFERALIARPSDPTLLAGLGRALHEAGETRAALDTLERALLADPGSAEAGIQRGVVLLDVSRTAEAVQTLREVVRLDPNRPEGHFLLANALLAAGDRMAAKESYGRALELEPTYKDRHLQLGRWLHLVSASEERALRMYEYGLALNPSHPELEHMVAALAGKPGPSRAPDEFIVSHFDTFAGIFDETLVERLEYGIPQLIVDAVRRNLDPGKRAGIDVLDAGCGTGLCGPLLRPLASRLIGVDLSAEMLRRASARGAYDELRVGEITETMTAEPCAYDLIVAADVLIYFGDLRGLLRAVATSLRPGGIAAVSVERHDGPDYVFRATGRYAHSAEYLQDTALEVGLRVVETRGCQVRLERGEPVAGYVHVLEAAR